MNQPPDIDVNALLTAMTDVVLVISREGRFLWAAPTLAAHVPRNRIRAEEMLGRTVHEVLNDDEQADRIMAAVRAALDTGETQQVEYRVMLWGEEAWFSANASRISDGRVVWVARNITEQVRARFALEERVEERTRDLAVLLDVSRELTAARTLGALARTVLEQAKRVIDYTGSAAVEFEGDHLRVLESTGPGGREDYLIDARTDTRPGGDLWERIRRGESVIVDDIHGESEHARQFRETWRADLHTPGFAYLRSWMAIPLGLGGKVVGLLSLSKDEPGYFTPRHLDLALAIARQASIAADNANLFESTQRRTEELDALLDISRALSSTLELRPLLEMILDRVKPLLGCDGAGVSLLEGDGIRQFAVRRPPGVPATDADQAPVSVSPATDAIWQHAMGGRPLIVPSVLGDSPEAQSFREIWGGQTKGTPVEYVRSLMTIPLVSKDRTIGVLNFASSQEGYFNQRHADLVMAVAGPAAAAIENARLFEQTQARTRELGALLEVSKAVSSTLDLGEVLGGILDQLGAITEHTGASILLLKGDAFEFVEARSVTGLRAESGARIRFEVAPMLAQATRRGEIVIIADIRADEPMAADYRAAIGSLGVLDRPPFNVVRSWMAVPLALQDRILGILTVSWTEPAHFTQDHARLVRALADQAAIAIENARLFERTQAQTKELSALLDVSQAVASTLDLRALMGVILDQLHSIVAHAGSAIVVREGEQLVITDARSAEGADREIGGRIPLQSGWLIWQEIAARRTVIIDDIRGDEPLAEAYRSAIDAIGLLDVPPFSEIRAWMAVPLVVSDDVIGMLTMSRPEPGLFTEEHARVAAAFANQAALAMENARLFDDAGRHAREMEALFRSDEKIFRSLDLDDVLRALVDVAIDLLGAEKALVNTRDPQRDLLVPRAARGWSREAIDFMRSPQGALAPDPPPDRMQVHMSSVETVSGLWRDLLTSEGIHHWAEIALISPEGEILGTFAASYAQDRDPTEAEQRMLLALAERAVIAISNADLHARAQQVTALEERQRLARELHDSVSQALYGIALGARTARTQLEREPANAVEPVDYVLSLAEAGLAEMRALIFELRPESLETEGLIPALEKQVAATRARYALEVTAELPSDEPAISIEQKEALYRIAQEALHNVVKHANARAARLSLTQDPDALTLTVSDDGGGFDPKGDFPGHLGLRSMRERAERAGITLTIESRPGAGSTVLVRLPLSG